MKRLLFIFGILIIVILTGILLFLLFAKDTTKEEIFATFGFGGTELGDLGETITDFFTPEDATPAALRQLSLKPTIGMVELTPTASSSQHMLYFAEAGTGHIFALDVQNGSETRVSNVTIPTAQRAKIAHDGSMAVVASDLSQNGSTLTIVELVNTLEGPTPESYELNERAEDFTITSDNLLLYTTAVGNSLIGKQYDVSDMTTKTLFELPFTEAVVLWGKASTDTIYTYPKPTAELEGALYEINNGALARLPLSGFGFTAGNYGPTLLFSLRDGNTYRSFRYSPEDNMASELGVPILPEKCASGIAAGSAIMCGSSFIAEASAFPDSWYRGTTSGSDDLWLTDAINGSQELLSSTLDDSGRELDAILPALSSDEQRFYFINKNDRSLWLFDRAVSNLQ